MARSISPWNSLSSQTEAAEDLLLGDSSDEELELLEQLPAPRRTEAYHEGLGDREPADWDYLRPVVLCRVPARYTEAQARERAQRDLTGKDYERSQLFRTGRHWVFYALS